MGRNKLVKVQNAEKKDIRTNGKARDRFSELPNAIAHRILSLVPTVDAVRMSLVSKRWRDVWYSLPVLAFSNSDFDDDSDADSDADSDSSGRVEGNKDSGFVSKCLKLRRMDMLNLTDTGIAKFKLSTRCTFGRNVNRWLRLVAKSSVKELDLCIFGLFRHMKYVLPSDVLCIRSLTHMRLRSVRLDKSLPTISLPFLMSLSLEYVSLEDETLNDLLSGCPVLEKLILFNCTSLSTPTVSNSSLKFLDVVICVGEMFQVEATNLESLKCSGISGSEVRSNRLFFGTLRTLSFSSISLNHEWLEDLIPRLPCLESLSLVGCKLKHAKICSEHLKRFTFKSIESDLTIDAPNLLYFSFEGYPMLDVSMDVPNLLEARVRFFKKAYDTSWYTNLIYFLSNLDCSKTLCLHVDSEEGLIIPCRLQKVFKVPLPVLKHLKVRTSGPLLRSKELKDSLFWMIPSLQTLSMEKEEGFNICAGVQC